MHKMYMTSSMAHAQISGGWKWSGCVAKTTELEFRTGLKTDQWGSAVYLKLPHMRLLILRLLILQTYSERVKLYVLVQRSWCSTFTPARLSLVDDSLTRAPACGRLSQPIERDERAIECRRSVASIYKVPSYFKTKLFYCVLCYWQLFQCVAVQ